MIRFRIDAWHPKERSFDIAAFGFLPPGAEPVGEPDYCTTLPATTLGLLIGRLEIDSPPARLVGSVVTLE